ncbi:MAG: hypothetical protein EBX37_07370, partial [Alphaproteobacteria bacterium]|nr:hypothetical protein [Alphaproteobacteria bacterium]
MQAEAMMVTNDGLEASLQRFDPTSRLYMGQMKLPVGAKSAEWQQYETSARQFIDPLFENGVGDLVERPQKIEGFECGEVPPELGL